MVAWKYLFEVPSTNTYLENFALEKDVLINSTTFLDLYPSQLNSV